MRATPDTLKTLRRDRLIQGVRLFGRVLFLAAYVLFFVAVFMVMVNLLASFKSLGMFQLMFTLIIGVLTFVLGGLGLQLLQSAGVQRQRLAKTTTSLKTLYEVKAAQGGAVSLSVEHRDVLGGLSATIDASGGLEDVTAVADEGSVLASSEHVVLSFDEETEPRDDSLNEVCDGVDASKTKEAISAQQISPHHSSSTQ